MPSLAVRELRRRLYQVVADRSRQQSQVVNRVFNNLFDQVEELESRVVELSRTLMATAASAGDSMSTIYSLPDESRRHASVEFTPPSGRRTSRWMRRNQPRPAELEIWETGVRQGLVADLESQLRRDVVTVGAPLLDLGHNLSDLTADAGRDLAGAVDGWFEEVHRLAMDDSHHRLVAMVIIASALGPVDSVVTAKVLGGGHLDRIDSARRSLETRVQAVHSHHLERLEEAWQLNMGHSETESLGERLTAVAATYQFADA